MANVNDATEKTGRIVKVPTEVFFDGKTPLEEIIKITTDMADIARMAAEGKRYPEDRRVNPFTIQEAQGDKAVSESIGEMILRAMRAAGDKVWEGAGTVVKGVAYATVIAGVALTLNHMAATKSEAAGRHYRQPAGVVYVCEHVIVDKRIDARGNAVYKTVEVCSPVAAQQRVVHGDVYNSSGYREGRDNFDKFADGVHAASRIIDAVNTIRHVVR